MVFGIEMNPFWVILAGALALAAMFVWLIQNQGKRNKEADLYAQSNGWIDEPQSLPTWRKYTKEYEQVNAEVKVDFRATPAAPGAGDNKSGYIAILYLSDGDMQLGTAGDGYGPKQALELADAVMENALSQAAEGQTITRETIKQLHPAAIPV